MTTNDEILETIQQIGGIFQLKNIPTVPVNLEFLDVQIAPGMESLVVAELIMHLEDLFAEYYEKKKIVHKYTRYIDSFRVALGDNSEGGNLVGRTKRSA